MIEVGSYEEGLTKVQNGELFGFIGNMMSVGHALQENKIYDVKIAGRIGHDNRMSVATRNDDPMLLEIFQKLVDSIQPRERQEIMNRWIAIRFEQGFDYRLFWRILAVFAIVGAVTVFWATKLRRLNRELHRVNQRLADISRHDALTGLSNRMHFDEILPSTTHLCSRNALTMTLAVLDLDHFKDINDSFGHPFGDACLRQLAAALKQTFRRDSDVTVRYGGEEFILISIGGTSAEMLDRLDSFRRDIARAAVAFDGRQASLTISIGVWSAIPDVDEDPVRILKDADAALYRAKRAGRNQLVVADSTANHVVEQRA